MACLNREGRGGKILELKHHRRLCLLPLRSYNLLCVHGWSQVIYIPPLRLGKECRWGEWQEGCWNSRPKSSWGQRDWIRRGDEEGWTHDEDTLEKDMAMHHHDFYIYLLCIKMNKEEQDFLLIHIFTPKDHSRFNSTDSFLPTCQIFLIVKANLLLSWHHGWQQVSLLWITRSLQITLPLPVWIICYLSNSKSFFSLAGTGSSTNTQMMWLWAVLSHSHPQGGFLPSSHPSW